MALIDEYKEAIQRVLDGRTKPAPKPSELPDTDDKLATFWAAAAALGLVPAPSGGGEKFIVTLTPTSPDFSGTMDKTPEEINAAYEAGQEIVFRVYASASVYYDLRAVLLSKATSDTNASFCSYGILTERFVVFETDVSDAVYSTAIYALTPAS